MVGGSYSGALTAWTESVAPGTFWAYHATSAPVEAIYDFVGVTCFCCLYPQLTRSVAILLPHPARYGTELQQGRVSGSRVCRQGWKERNCQGAAGTQGIVWLGSC